ncbi:WXG100 family type VII secretion target [Streptomyces sp. NPDC001903]|uniref:WXG100 family type VII secretion target n=1 Tax=Streptomyces sp. NPDC001903 TaxID=3364622 RepID=UPI003677F5F5
MATNFEGYTHQQLLAMIASLDAETVKTRGTQLTEAAKTIKEIGESLKKHRVKGWEGEAATAFENWVGQTGSATLRLGDYSEAGGKWMTEAAQTMVEVKKNMPAYDADAAANLKAAHDFHNDPDAQKMGQEAHAKLNGDHQKAVDALTKLAGSYDQSTTQMGKAEIPTFPPPPGEFTPSNYNDGVDMERGGGAGGATGSSHGSSYSPSSPSPSNPTGDVPGHQRDTTLPSPTGPTTPVPRLPDQDVNVDLNHVSTLPDKTLPPVTGLPTVPGPSPTTGGTPPVFTPPVALPPIGAPSPVGGGPGGKFQVATPPLGKVSGTGGLLPRDTGIMGGRPVTTNGPSAGIPRGTVIGQEGGGQQGLGRGMGGGMHPGGGGGPHGGGPGGSAMGRRLAMEPGGVVGGRQSAPIGRPTTGGQPFTQGGSGLVRNGSGAGSARGAMGHAGAGLHAPGNRRDQQGGERPDYLAEDEETWQSNDRVVPPVVD